MFKRPCTRMKIYLAAPFGMDRRDWCLQNGLGLLYSPTYVKYPRTCENEKFVLDNGAFSAHVRGAEWDEIAFYHLVERVACDGLTPAFVVLPDIVAGGILSLERSAKHIDRLPSSWSKYLAVQDGIKASDVRPYIDAIDGLFVGGSVVWKWRTAAIWGKFAHEHGISCHIGRVNSGRQFLQASAAGADSVDGSTASRHHRMYRILKYQGLLKEQRVLEKEDFNLSLGVALYQDYRMRLFSEKEGASYV